MKIGILPATLVPHASAEEATLFLDSEDSNKLKIKDENGEVINPAGGGGGVVSLKISLTAEQIRNLSTTAVELIPTPGEGKAINIMNVAWRLNYNSVPFSSNYLQVNTNSKNIYSSSPPEGGSTINSENSRFNRMFELTEFIIEGGNGIGEDKNVIIYADIDSEFGDSTVDIFLTYEILS